MYLFTGGNMLRKFLLVIICSLLIIPQSVFSAELTDFVPADAGVFIRLNLKQIFSNPEIKAKYDEFFAEAKFDYVKDIKDSKEREKILKAKEQVALKKYKKENHLTKEQEESMERLNKILGL